MESQFLPKHEAEADDTGKIHLANELKEINVDLILPETEQETSIARSEILDFGDEGFLLNNVLSVAECKNFIDEGERVGFDKIYGSNDNYRSSQRVSIDSPELAERLWQRIHPWLSDIVIEGNPHAQHIHGVTFLLQGKWTPVSLNSVFRLCRYGPGGHFAPHYDGHFERNTQERSLQTFMLYLNDDFDGGTTNFVDEQQNLFMDSEGKYCAEEKNIMCRVHPRPGLAIIFNHHRLHEGQKLGNGVKYILRTDIMFQNTAQRNRSPNEEKALQLVQEAERKEGAGECTAAAELYRKAFKLSADIAAAYGN